MAEFNRRDLFMMGNGDGFAHIADICEGTIVGDLNFILHGHEARTISTASVLPHHE
jgi:hypothetical protein